MSCHHCNLMAEYRAIREAEEQAAEMASAGYQTELKEYWANNPRTTFKDFLIGMKQLREMGF